MHCRVEAPDAQAAKRIAEERFRAYLYQQVECGNHWHLTFTDIRERPDMARHWKHDGYRGYLPESRG